MESKAKMPGHPIHQTLIVFPLGMLATAVILMSSRTSPRVLAGQRWLSTRSAQVS